MSVARGWARTTGRRWRTGVLVFGLVSAAGLAVLLLSRPVYRAEASLRLGEPPPPGGVSPSGGILSFLQPGGDPFANDLELLASRSLAEEVVASVGLNASLEAPAGWHRDSLLLALETSRATDEAVYELSWNDGALRAVRTSPEDSVIGDVPPGSPAELGGVTAVFRPRLPDAPSSFALRTVPFAEAVRITRGRIQVDRPRREANVVTLAYDHTDPGVARSVVASVVAEFVRLRTALQERESGETVDSLRRVARSTALELEEAERALERVQSAERIVAPDAQSEALVERQTELLADLQRARSERAAVDETLRRLDAARDPGTSWTALLSYPAFLENETLGTLLTRLTTAHAEREALASRRTPANRDLRVLDQEIEYLDASLRRIAAEYRVGLDERIVALEPQVDSLDRVMAGLPGRALEFGRRQRDVRILSEVLVLTEQRLRQEELREALTYANVQVIDPPALRDRPVWPRKKLGAAVLFLLASGSGLLGMVVRERTDLRLRDAEDVERATDLPVLAVVEEPGDGEALAEEDVARIVRAADPAEGGLVAVSAGPETEALARRLGGAPPEGRASGGGGLGGGVSVRDRADAATVVRAGVPAVLLARRDVSSGDEIRRVAELIVGAGGRVAGVVLIDGPSRRGRKGA